MNLLIAGVLLWAALHLMATLRLAPRKALISRIGSNPYRGLFSLGIVLALVLIVLGWRSTPETYLYVLPPWSRTLGMLLVLLAFILFGAAQYPTRIKRVLRHPMLTGLVVWSVAHLLMNGTTRALVLFGGLGSWALSI